MALLPGTTLRAQQVRMCPLPLLPIRLKSQQVVSRSSSQLAVSRSCSQLVVHWLSVGLVVNL